MRRPRSQRRLQQLPVARRRRQRTTTSRPRERDRENDRSTAPIPPMSSPTSTTRTSKTSRRSCSTGCRRVCVATSSSTVSEPASSPTFARSYRNVVPVLPRQVALPEWHERDGRIGADARREHQQNGQPDKEPEITGMIFEVTIDGHDLGYWSKVDGLSVKFEVAEYRAGDGSNRRWIEPAFTTYSNVKLGRGRRPQAHGADHGVVGQDAVQVQRRRPRRSRAGRSGTTSATSRSP